MALLDGLRAGLQSDVVALFDDDRSDPAGAPPLNFWDALDRGPCADIAFDGWYRTLRAEGKADEACGCGAGHRLQGYLIHHRWALLVIPAGPVRSDGVAAIASCVRALADCLPPGRQPDPVAQELTDEDGATDRHDPLIWWVRRQPH